MGDILSVADEREMVENLGAIVSTDSLLAFIPSSHDSRSRMISHLFGIVPSTGYTWIDFLHRRIIRGSFKSLRAIFSIRARNQSTRDDEHARKSMFVAQERD